VDGGLVNTSPLNRAERRDGDILVGFNVNRIEAEQINAYLAGRRALAESGAALREEAQAVLRDTIASDTDLLSKVRKAGEEGSRLLHDRLETDRLEKRLLAAGRADNVPFGADDNYASILQRSFGIMNHTIARMGIDLCPPDILVNLPFDSYHGVYGYSHAPEIIARGRELMGEALDRYEASAA